jgi:hypothetical protein
MNFFIFFYFFKYFKFIVFFFLFMLLQIAFLKLIYQNYYIDLFQKYLQISIIFKVVFIILELNDLLNKFNLIIKDELLNQ